MSMRSALIGLVAFISVGSAYAVDNGQYENVDPAVREWFRGVRAPSGVPCCDIADGHRTQFKVEDDKLMALIEDKWVPVPPESIVKGSRNPTGDAVIWWVRQGEGYYVRCFVLPELS